MFWRFKNWLLRLTEPWREEEAALDLEYRTYAQKHNAAGKRPPYWYPGIEPDPMEKVALVDAHEVSPNYLRDQFADEQDQVRLRDKERVKNLRFSNRKGAVEEDK